MWTWTGEATAVAGLAGSSFGDDAGWITFGASTIGRTFN
jgi:hypothetical protein